MTTRRTALTVLALACVATTSACGTRVQLDASGAAPQSASGLNDLTGTDTGASAAPTPTPTDGGLPTLPDESGDESPPTDEPGTPTNSQPGNPQTGAPVIPNAPGMTATRIKIGAYTVQAFDSIAASGGSSSDSGDQAGLIKLVTEYINKHGGIAGRQVDLVIHDADASVAASNPDQEQTNACSAWTEDQRVYTVVSVVGTLSDTLFQCLQKKSVTIFSTGDNRDAQAYRTFADTFYSPGDMNLSSILGTSAKTFASQNYFGKAPKIGIIRLDTPSEARAVQQGLRPALASRGLKLDQEAAVSASASGTAEYAGVVLRFKAAGITHVFFTGLTSPAVFGVIAQQQGYHPRYLMSSLVYPQAFIAKNLGPNQLANSVVLGWHPYSDVNAAHDPGPVSNRARTCVKIFTSGGISLSNRQSANLAMGVCDTMFLLQDALRNAQDYGRSGLRTAVESLGRFESANTFIGEFTPTQLHDGARGFRTAKYDTACSCFQYYGPVQRVSP